MHGPHRVDAFGDRLERSDEAGNLMRAEHRVLCVGSPEVDVRSWSSAVGVAGEPALNNEPLPTASGFHILGRIDVAVVVGRLRGPQ